MEIVRALSRAVSGFGMFFAFLFIGIGPGGKQPQIFINQIWEDIALLFVLLIFMWLLGFLSAPSKEPRRG